MATLIPRSPLPETRVAPIPQAQQTTRLDNSHLSAGALRLGKQLNQVFEREMELADQAALMEARSALSAWEGQVNDPSNPNGRFKYQGKAALEAGDNLLPQADSEIARIRSTLSGRQQRQFDAIATNFKAQFHEGLNRWSSQQFMAYEDATYKATVENLTQDAVSAGLSGDFDRQAAIGNELLLMNRAHLTTRGMGEELVKMSERGLASGIHAATLDGMIVNDPLGAQAYYQRFADQMQPGDRAKVERALYPVIEDLAGQSYADAIIGGVPVQADAPEDIDAAIVSLESGGNDSAKADGSSATGAGQFIESTWLDVIKRHRPDLADGRTDAELLAMRTDGALSREMVAAYRRDNTAHLQAHGAQVTAANVYAAHHFGPAGGVRFAKASSDTSIHDILTPGQIKSNPYLRGMTKGEVLANWQRRGLPVSESAPSAAAGEAGAAPGGQRTQAEAIAYARENIRDPRLRDATVRKIRDHYTLQEAARNEAERAASERTINAVNADPTVPLVRALSPDDYATLAAAGKIPSMENYRRAMLDGQLIQSDPVLIEEIDREMVLNPTAFAKRDVRAMADRLAAGDLARYLKAQSEINKPENRAKTLTDQERIERALTGLGLSKIYDARGSGSQKRNATRDQMRGEYRLLYQRAVETYIQLNGEEPTPEAADAIMRHTQRTFAENMRQGTTGIYSDVQQFRASITEVDRRRVRDAWTAKYGQPPTDAELTVYFARLAKRDGKAGGAK